MVWIWVQTFHWTSGRFVLRTRLVRMVLRTSSNRRSHSNARGVVKRRQIVSRRPTTNFLVPVTPPNNLVAINSATRDPLALESTTTITTPNNIITGNVSPNFQQENQALQQQPTLSSEAGAQDTAAWLHLNRFAAWAPTFASFAAADLLRLSRDDLIEICGLADGIRLFNALHSKAITPRLTLYLCVESTQSNGINTEGVFHAIYLSSSTCSELASKLAQLLGINTDNVRDVFLRGPHGIHVLMTNEVVSNLHDHSMFVIEILPTENNADQRFRILLKPTGR